jgi:hypothetical protein
LIDVWNAEQKFAISLTKPGRQRIRNESNVLKLPLMNTTKALYIRRPDRREGIMKQRIHVRNIQPGMFSTERFVAFTVGDQEYSLLVDHSSVQENEKTLDVQVIETKGDETLVELPRASFNAGSRLLIPSDSVLSY